MAKHEPDSRFLDSQYRHVRQCLKEARFVAIIWFAALFFCCGWIVTFGYIPPAERPDTPTLLLGIPSWAVWGLLVPWLILILITWFFAAFILKDDEPLQAMPGFEDELPSGHHDEGTEKAEYVAPDEPEIRKTGGVP